jgi:xanthine dehydrogenase molybdopterin-binding subunit B
VVLVDDKGNLRIHAPSTYKIRRGDVPAAFNVSLFRAGRSEEDVIYCSRLSTNPIVEVSAVVAVSVAAQSCNYSHNSNPNSHSGVQPQCQPRRRRSNQAVALASALA